MMIRPAGCIAHRRFAALAACVLAAAASACGREAETPATPAASFVYRVRGDLERTIRGSGAKAGPASVPGAGEVWSLELSGGTGNESGAVALITRTGPPDPGTHALSDATTPAALEDGELGLFVLLSPDQPGDRFIGAASTGEVTLEKADGTLAGTLSATVGGQVYPEAEESRDGTLELTGSFTVPVAP